jgi:hypothetical protein
MPDTIDSGRFVILEHVWNGVHWDFMIEQGSGLRTWAIDAPIVTGADLPARWLPDHRLAYLDYEGPVSGERGWVRRIDRGTYRILEHSEARLRLALWGCQLVGEVVLNRSRDESTGSESWTFRLGNFD